MSAITEKNTMRQSMWTKVGPFAEVLKMDENAKIPVPGPLEVLIKVT